MILRGSIKPHRDVFRDEADFPNQHGALCKRHSWLWEALRIGCRLAPPTRDARGLGHGPRRRMYSHGAGGLSSPTGKGTTFAICCNVCQFTKCPRRWELLRRGVRLRPRSGISLGRGGRTRWPAGRPHHRPGGHVHQHQGAQLVVVHALGASRPLLRASGLVDSRAVGSFPPPAPTLHAIAHG